MKPPAPTILSRPASHWIGPVLFSVAVHAALATGYVFFDAAYTPPQPPTVFPIEVILASEMPGLGEASPSEPVESVAQAPSAPAERQQAIEKPPITEPDAERSLKAATEPDRKSAPPAERIVSLAPEPDMETAPVSHPAKVALPDNAPVEPWKQVDNAQFQQAVFAPRPKRKPVLTPPPIRKTALPAAQPPNPDEPSASAASREPVEQPAARPAPRSSVKASDSSLPAIASAGEATAKLVPPSYAAPGRGNPLPTYPRSAKRRGIEGRLILRVRVRADGRAGSVEIIDSSGHALLDRAAERAVRKWTFQPARRAGIPVSAMLDVPVVFRLRN